ncbi:MULTISPECIES: bifunctional biotin--[acetyl-CoA-carboxylase] ligase/biotin operon repressor BirA [Providencia]|uniref:bifunctional biotin--[acetyl-CoA-carboxylase] ligase/biotin operon repressor BirA n=1 Tax=Providencia TaxID=586 RepID=UPI000D6EC881|nr:MULTISPECIES: bifunctional biotin--[acetyl-CoA-carboxylase] ligase/biotin operon repressor BirA [Providencia]MCL0020990.1 bifunctional biotin--[acetyl-CoA-carboxylase] ligase/biotin operon repressor BirA [Providencia rettgeri]QZY64285.1 bifunctional biotin--[acetyl-CoA-carboxylase] ligase/biotin operon repressor BirA [Providencia rettgeri]WOB81976.1 bifunctional biotin--[acetyl-CoA-carboxylase] ligase/biotin operon repressor BirA [Providencia sp. PROV114]HEE8952029.1 bifunctional biotin--[ac
MKETNIPLQLIDILADAQVHSGEQLGEQLGMTRSAINKHIKTLRSWGLNIETIAGKGYKLPYQINLLSEEAIKKQIDDVNIIVEPVIDSTNQYMLERIAELKSGDTCLAEYQSAGRGRRGRQWISPFGCNLYLSMYWRLEQGPAAAVGLSLVVGIVIAEVLNRISQEKVKVKWPNDLYMNDKKLAGILVELTGKTGDAAHIIIGVGINIGMNNNNIESSKSITQEWSSLRDEVENIERNELSANIIKSLRESLVIFEYEGLKPFLERWFKLDNFLNRHVKLLIGNDIISGIERGVNDQGALLLQKDNGEIIPYIGGEISLRLNE